MRNDTTDSADEFFAKYYDVGTDLDNDDDDSDLDTVNYVLVRRTDLNDLAAVVRLRPSSTTSTSTSSRRPPPRRQLRRRRRRRCRRPLTSEPPPPSASPKYRRFGSNSGTRSRSSPADRHADDDRHQRRHRLHPTTRLPTGHDRRPVVSRDGANPDGTIDDVPGWILQPNGLWVRDDSDAFLREGIGLTYELNPMATAFATLSTGVVHLRKS